MYSHKLTSHSLYSNHINIYLNHNQYRRNHNQFLCDYLEQLIKLGNCFLKVFVCGFRKCASK